MHQATARAPNSLTFGMERRTLVSEFRGGHACLPATLRIMSGAGDFHAPVRRLRYPRNAGHRDLTRIGQDMYRAMERYAAEAPGT